MFRSTLAAVTRHSRRSCTFVVAPTTTPASFIGSTNHNHLRWATTLVLADPSTTSPTIIAPGTCQAMTAANELKNDKITLLIVGGNATPAEVPMGTTKIVHVPFSNDDDTVVLPETVAAAVHAAVQADSDITHVIATSSKFGSTVLPRAAALLTTTASSSGGGGCSPIHDVVQVLSSDTFVRPMYAGNVLIKVQMTDAIKVISIRPTAFEKTALTSSADVPTESMKVEAFTKSTFIHASNSSADQQDRPDLSSADIVVTGGRGMGHRDQFQLLEQLADALGGAAIGASRAAVDAGMAPNDLQVGQTGKVVAPNLYIAVGVSGAIQHLSGMKDSKTIVAINKDADAPIFQVADYGLVADLFDAVPEMTKKLKDLKG